MDKHYKLFVGGLPVRTSKDTIVEFFAKYGTVLSCKLKLNPQTGRSLGFAYLNIQEKEACETLLNEPIEFQGRIIDIKPVWKKKELGDKLEQERKRKLFVSGFPIDFTNKELTDYFTKFGRVSNAFIIKDPDTSKNKNYGYVIFEEVSGLENALSQEAPLVVRESIHLKLQKCLNPAEIAQMKQSSSYKSSNTSQQSPHGKKRGFLLSDDRNISPIRDFKVTETERVSSERNIGAINNQPRQFKDLNFSPPPLMRKSLSPKHIKASINRFGNGSKGGAMSGVTEKKSGRGFHFDTRNLVSCGVSSSFVHENVVPEKFENVQASLAHEIDCQFSQNGGQSPAKSAAGSQSRMAQCSPGNKSPARNRKTSMLALSEKLDEKEDNYRFSLQTKTTSTVNPQGQTAQP